MFDALGDLQNIAEEMFVRFYTASGTAAQERGRNLTLMQEVQRLEEENGRLRTEMDNEQDKLARARDEVEKCAEIVKNQLRAVEKLKEENRVLSEENYKMETQIRQMVAKEAKDRIATAPAEPRNDNAMVGAVACPRCGSMDVTTDGFGRKGHCACNVCAKVFEVKEEGRDQSR